MKKNQFHIIKEIKLKKYIFFLSFFLFFNLILLAEEDTTQVQIVANSNEKIIIRTILFKEIKI